MVYWFQLNSADSSNQMNLIDIEKNVSVFLVLWHHCYRSLDKQWILLTKVVFCLVWKMMKFKKNLMQSLSWNPFQGHSILITSLKSLKFTIESWHQACPSSGEIFIETYWVWIASWCNLHADYTSSNSVSHKEQSWIIPVIDGVITVITEPCITGRGPVDCVESHTRAQREATSWWIWFWVLCKFPLELLFHIANVTQRSAIYGLFNQWNFFTFSRM